MRPRESTVFKNFLSWKAYWIAPQAFPVPKELSMSEFVIFLFVIALWFFLQAWLLPRLGVST
jgi:hypothetical protein